MAELLLVSYKVTALSILVEAKILDSVGLNLTTDTESAPHENV